MSSWVASELRKMVAERAGWRCEYCLLHEVDTYFGCQVDHVVSEKHHGPTIPENLALACVLCNQSKGSDIGSIVRGTFVRFFNPRTDRWADHFRLDYAQIVPLTDIGEATAKILKFNQIDRILERQALWEAGRYPKHETH